jgi:hypothetical protein
MEFTMSDVTIAPRRTRLPVLEIFDVLGVEPITRQDTFSIEYAPGLLTATINRANGPIEVVRRSIGHDGFAESTFFDPGALTREQRNDIICTFSDAHMTQSEIARRTGIHQTTVSNVLRKRRKE